MRLHNAARDQSVLIHILTKCLLTPSDLHHDAVRGYRCQTSSKHRVRDKHPVLVFA